MPFYEYLHQQLPCPSDLLELSPEELAGFILEFMQTGAGGDRSWRGSDFFPISVRSVIQSYPVEYTQAIHEAVAAARNWLLGEQLIVQTPGQADDYYSLTERGRRVRGSEGIQAYRQSKLLNKELLHPRIAERTWDDFRRGRYDEAIFAGFKEIEVAVRQAGGFDTRDLGTDLMRRAFNPDNGPLRDPGTIDPNATRSEQIALSDLFAGGIGLFKNPQSHRYVGINDAKTAVEVLMFASLLYRLLEDRLTGLGLPIP